VNKAALTIACFKWRRSAGGHVLPHVCDYTAEHVNILQRMLARHLTIPYRMVCITDDPEGVGCETIPLWDKCSELGGCFNRLYAFSPDMRGVLGQRFALIDLDVVITGNCDHIFGLHGDFIIHRYQHDNCKRQYYNGSLMIMDAGARAAVWNSFRGQASVDSMRGDKSRIGSDQKWISTVLGPGERTLGQEVGIFEALRIGGRLPTTAPTWTKREMIPAHPVAACMVFFSGARDPSCREHGWVRQHYV